MALQHWRNVPAILACMCIFTYLLYSFSHGDEVAIQLQQCRTQNHTQLPVSIEQKCPTVQIDTSCMPELMIMNKCRAKHHEHALAVIVAYRDRPQQLSNFTTHMNEFLLQQNIYYHIFIMEQEPDLLFNRAKLFNIGYNLTNRYFDYYCFHDVDSVPIEYVSYGYFEGNPYSPAEGIEKYNWTIPYGNFVGVVLCMTKAHMLKTNGWPNKFWGWGAEDDDMSGRLSHVGLKPIVRPEHSAKFMSMGHTIAYNPHWGENVALLKNTTVDMFFDGLNSLADFKVNEITLSVNFSKYLVKLN